MDQAPLRFGILGAADIGWRRTLPAMSEEPTARIVAVASRDGAKAARFADRFGAQAVTGYEALLERDDLDAVYIPLPTGLHAQWAAKALERGLHVLCEKPLSTDHESAEALLDRAARAGLVLWENLTFVHHTAHRTIRDLVSDGAIGTVRAVTAVFGIPPLPAGDIRYRPELGGGALLDLGIYVAQTAVLFLGPSVDLVGASLRVDPDTGVDVEGAVLLRADSGATAQLSFGFRHSYASSYTLWGDGGRLHLDRAFTPPPTMQPVVRIDRQDGSQTIALPAENQFGNAVRSFVDAVRAGEPRPHDKVSILRRAGLLDAIRERAAEVAQPALVG